MGGDCLDSIDDIFSCILSANWALPPPIEETLDLFGALDDGLESLLPELQGECEPEPEPKAQVEPLPEPAPDCVVDGSWTDAINAIDSVDVVVSQNLAAAAAGAAAAGTGAYAEALPHSPFGENPAGYGANWDTMRGHYGGNAFQSELGVGDWTVPEVTYHVIEGYDEDGRDVEDGHRAGAGFGPADTTPVLRAPVPLPPLDGPAYMLPVPLCSLNGVIHEQQHSVTNISGSLSARYRHVADEEFEQALTTGLFAPPRRWTDEERVIHPPELVDTRRCLDLQPAERETLRWTGGDGINGFAPAAQGQGREESIVDSNFTHPEPRTASRAPPVRPRRQRPSRAGKSRAAKAKAAQAQEAANQAIKDNDPVKQVNVNLKLRDKEAVEYTNGDQTTLTSRLNLQTAHEKNVEAKSNEPVSVPVRVVKTPFGPARILPRPYPSSRTAFVQAPAESLEDQLRRMTAPSRQLGGSSNSKTKELQLWNRSMDVQNLRAVEDAISVKRARASTVTSIDSQAESHLSAPVRVQVHAVSQAQRPRPANANAQPDPYQTEPHAGTSQCLPVTFFGWSPVNGSTGAVYNLQPAATAEGGAPALLSAYGSGAVPDLPPAMGFFGNHEFAVVDSSRPDYVIACDSGAGWTYNAIMQSERAYSSAEPISIHAHEERVAGYSTSGPLFPYALIDLQPAAALNYPLPVQPSPPAYGQAENPNVLRQQPSSPRRFTTGGTLTAEETDQDSTGRGVHQTQETVSEDDNNSAEPANPELAGHSPGDDGTRGSADGGRTLRCPTIYWPRFGNTGGSPK